MEIVPPPTGTLLLRAVAVSNVPKTTTKGRLSVALQSQQYVVFSTQTDAVWDKNEHARASCLTKDAAMFFALLLLFRSRYRLYAPLAVMCFVVGACAKGSSENPQASENNDSSSNANASGQQAGSDSNATTSNIAPIVWPNIGFVNNPGNNDPKAVALSFDDGPDGQGSTEGKAGKTNMSRILDVLEAKGLKATFFLCGNKSSNVLTDTLAQQDIQRMLSAGHHFGSHTYEHPTLDANMTVEQIKAQFTQNDAIFADAKLLGPTRVPFTMYRTPYGTPFQDGVVYPPTANAVQDVVYHVAPGTSSMAVHVGWGIDSKDWQCADATSATTHDSNCIMTNINTFLSSGASGVILMHAIYKLTADTLPEIIQSIADHNYHIVMVEDFIKAKYGATSAEIYAANKQSASLFDDTSVQKAAFASTQESKWFKMTNEN